MWVALALAPAQARGDPPAVNQIQGIVVFKTDGRPAAGVPVAMAHAEKGYLHFTEWGLVAGGHIDTVLHYFPKRNGFYGCSAVTDEAGRFTLSDFAAPDELWNLAAGTPELGYALKIRNRPQDVGDGSLKLELEPAASITLRMPSLPPLCTGYIEVAVARTADGETDAAAPADESDKVERIAPTGDWHRRRRGDVRIGAVPAGVPYRVSLSVSSPNLLYSPILFARTVNVAAGATEPVLLEGQDGVVVNGRLTSTEGKPLNMVSVSFVTKDGWAFGGLTDSDGKYEIRGVPAGNHRVELLRHAPRVGPG